MGPSPTYTPKDRMNGWHFASPTAEGDQLPFSRPWWSVPAHRQAGDDIPSRDIPRSPFAFFQVVVAAAEDTSWCGCRWPPAVRRRNYFSANGAAAYLFASSEKWQSAAAPGSALRNGWTSSRGGLQNGQLKVRIHSSGCLRSKLNRLMMSIPESLYRCR